MLVSYFDQDLIQFQRNCKFSKTVVVKKKKKKKRRRRGSYEFEPLSLEKICGSINPII
jgi:hypothetical protein